MSSQQSLQLPNKQHFSVGSFMIMGVVEFIGGIIMIVLLNISIVSETFETFDLKIPEDLSGKITEGVQVIYWNILNDKLLKQKTNEIEKIKKAWNKSVTIWKKQKKEVINVASSHIGIPERELTESLKKIEFFDEIPSDFNLVVDEIQRVLTKDKIINDSYSTDKLIIK